MALNLYDKLKHSIRFWLLRRLPNCQSTLQTISQSMERSLSFGERVKVKLHLWICAWCQWYLEHLQLIRAAARAHGDEAAEVVAAPTLSDEARDRIRRNLNSQN